MDQESIFELKDLRKTFGTKKEIQVPNKIEGVTVKQIGYVTDKPEICLTNEEGRVRPLLPQGFDHFRG